MRKVLFAMALLALGGCKRSDTTSIGVSTVPT